jgi:hypothetical protein
MKIFIIDRSDMILITFLFYLTLIYSIKSLLQKYKILNCSHKIWPDLTRITHINNISGLPNNGFINIKLNSYLI